MRPKIIKLKYYVKTKAATCNYKDSSWRIYNIRLQFKLCFPDVR